MREYVEALATITAALLATLGVATTIFVGRRRDREKSVRQQEALRSCLAADIDAILRVIDVARIVEHCVVQYFSPGRILPMASGPRQEDYFVLYNSTAKDLGTLDPEFAVKASAFYLLLKGSRDTAQSFEFLRRLERQEGKRISARELQMLVSEAARSVVDMLEHVYRNGFLASAIARKRDVGLSPQAPEQPKSQSESSLLCTQLFETWLFLFGLRGLLSVDPRSTPLTEENVREYVTRELREKRQDIVATLKGVEALSVPPMPPQSTSAYDSVKGVVSEAFIDSLASRWADRIMSVQNLHDSPGSPRQRAVPLWGRAGKSTSPGDSMLDTPTPRGGTAVNAQMVSVAIAGAGSDVEDGSELAARALAVGRIVALVGCNLITGGGRGVMEFAAEGFCKTPDRPGKSIGILPGSLSTAELPALGKTASLSLAPKPDYPNGWIEVPIYTHLPGKDPKAAGSRNYLNARSARILVALPGGEGTQAELEIALSLGTPTLALLSPGEAIGTYQRETLPEGVIVVETLDALSAELTLLLRAPEVSLARPTFNALSGVYQTDEANIHNCTIVFPHTCAIRMSEALARAVPGIMQKFAASGLNLCPHGYMRGAEDLAGVLRRADVFGLYDAGFSAPGSAPAGLNGKKGIVAYINIPNFSGQGHIDLWDGSSSVGSAYWDADPIWFWKLS